MLLQVILLEPEDVTLGEDSPLVGDHGTPQWAFPLENPCDVTPRATTNARRTRAFGSAGSGRSTMRPSTSNGW